jgi:hypothetical protein
MKRTRRLSDQVLILKSIVCVREELALANKVGADFRNIVDIMERLTSLYACLDAGRLADVAKTADARSRYEWKQRQAQAVPAKSRG